MLKHHASFSPYLIDFFQVCGHLDAVDKNLPALMLFQAIDAADHCRLAGTRRSADHDALAATDLQIDVAEHVEIAIPLVELDELDGRFRPEPARLEERSEIFVRGHELPLTAGHPWQDALPSREHSATCRSRRSDKKWRRPHSPSC